MSSKNFAWKRNRGITTVALAATAGLLLTGCQVGDADPQTDAENGSGNEVTVIAHDSFPTEEFEALAAAETGYEVRVIQSGDSGELATTLALSAGEPTADVFFGVDNLYASRLVTSGAVDPFMPDNFPDGAQQFAYDEAGSIVPIDYGSTCINIDHGWFAERGIAEPATLEDLATDTYGALTVLIDPTSSSTGGTFLLGTISEFGEDGFSDYWSSLVEHGVEIAEGWSSAYYGAFTQGGEGGTKPIVLSYSTSPAWTLTEDGTESTTKILPETCAQHVEYAGVLAGATNPQGARAVIEFMLSREFQDTIADSMFMYPVDDAAHVPEEWSTFAQIPAGGGRSVPAETIGESRDDWLKTWSEAVGY